MAVTSPNLTASSGVCFYTFKVRWTMDLSHILLTCGTVVSPGLMLIASAWLPESPRWLITKNRLDDALGILKNLHHTPEDKEDALAHEEFFQIQQQIQLDNSKPHKFRDLVKLPSYRRRFLIAFFIQSVPSNHCCRYALC